MEQIEEIFSYYDSQQDKGSQDRVVELLRELQEVCGCITQELKQRVMETTGVSESFLQCLIKLYPSLKEVRCSHEIIACTGERCGKKDGWKAIFRRKIAGYFEIAAGDSKLTGCVSFVLLDVVEKAWEQNDDTNRDCRR